MDKDVASASLALLKQVALAVKKMVIWILFGESIKNNYTYHIQSKNVYSCL